MEFVFSIIIFSMAIAGLSLGVIMGRNPPQSCSGSNDESQCGGCQQPCERRKALQQKIL